MDKNAPMSIFSVFESGDAATFDNARTDLLEVKLDIFGKRLHICIDAKNTPAKLSDLVPLARLLSTKITSITRRHITNNRDVIPCRPSCSQCCRYLVPLTIPEAMYLTEEVTAMAQSERTFVEESFLMAARCILELTPKHFVEKLTKTEPLTHSKLKDISDWYRQINLPCPFLLNGLCTIYEQRPVACREYLVTGSASNCKADGTNYAQRVKMPVSIFEALTQLTSELERTNTEVIILPFAIAWCRENPEYFKHTWPASELVRRFINVLTML